jgi:hypothetical protein
MYWQQGTQKIEIIVRKDSSGFVGANEIYGDEAVSQNSTENKKDQNDSKRSRTSNRKALVNSTHALAVSKQVLDLAIEYQVAGIGYRNGDQSLQEGVARNIERVKDLTNLASSVSMGMLYGSRGGMSGAVIGGLMAGISTATSLAVKYKGRERDYNYKIFKEQNAIEYNRARAGINLTNGRLR